MTDQPEGDRKALRNLDRALVERLLALTPEDFLAEEAEAGTNAEQEAKEVGQLFERAAGKARMAAARAGLAAHRAMPRSHQPAPANDLVEAKGLTMAARNGKTQAESDVRSVAEDLSELAAFKGKPTS